MYCQSDNKYCLFIFDHMIDVHNIDFVVDWIQNLAEKSDIGRISDYPTVCRFRTISNNSPQKLHSIDSASRIFLNFELQLYRFLIGYRKLTIQLAEFIHEGPGLRSLRSFGPGIRGVNWEANLGPRFFMNVNMAPLITTFSIICDNLKC